MPIRVLFHQVNLILISHSYQSFIISNLFYSIQGRKKFFFFLKASSQFSRRLHLFCNYVHRRCIIFLINCRIANNRKICSGAIKILSIPFINFQVTKLCTCDNFKRERKVGWQDDNNLLLLINDFVLQCMCSCFVLICIAFLFVICT